LHYRVKHKRLKMLQLLYRVAIAQTVRLNLDLPVCFVHFRFVVILVVKSPLTLAHLRDSSVHRVGQKPDCVLKCTTCVCDDIERRSVC